MSTPSDEALIAANDAFYRAFERLEETGMAERWAVDVPVSCVHPGWDLVLGHEAVMASWREIFAAGGSVRFEIDRPQATRTGPSGWVVCRETLHTTVQGQPVQNVMTAINTFVWEREEFRIAHHGAAPLLRGRKPAGAATLH